jgi:DNA repair and recombination RAD54-like protein
MSRPFKIPISNYAGPASSGRSGLGVKKMTVRAPLWPPTEDDAVVLYTPPPLTAEEKAMAASPNAKFLVHVVVDPVAGRILRPHQIEVCA